MISKRIFVALSLAAMSVLAANAQVSVDDGVDAPDSADVRIGSQEVPSASDTTSLKEDYGKYGWGRASRYRAFVGVAYIVDGDFKDETSVFFHTSHGYQVNPFVYTGVGIGALRAPCTKKWSMPVFADVRGEFHRLFKRNFSPFVDTRIGYSFGDMDGLYFSPSLGFHVYFGQSTKGVSVGFGCYSIGRGRHRRGGDIHGGDYYDYEEFSIDAAYEFTIAFDI